MFTHRFLLIRRLPTASALIWRHNQVNAMSEISPARREDIYQWNLAMTQSNKRKTPRSTLALFDKLISQHTDVKPDFITYLLALSACVRLSSLQDGKRIHHHLQQTWSAIVEKNEEVKVRTCLMQLYTTCGDLKTAEEIFYREQLEHQVMPVNTLMKGYLMHNRAASAIQLAEQLPNNERNAATFLLWANAVANLADRHMADHVHAALNERASTSRTLFINDDRLMNALINMDGKCGHLERMEETFRTIRNLDIVTFTTMAKAYIVNDLPSKALEMYDHAKQTKTIVVDQVMYLVASNAAGKLGLLSRARAIHNDLMASGLPYRSNEKLLNSLMDTYGKCGDLNAAREIFDRLPSRTKPFISSMINIYGINSHALEAVALYYETKATLTGNIQSILTSVLTACAHGGLAREAQKIFDEIPDEHRSIKMWNALVDVYGRAGQLVEALAIVRRFEETHCRAPVLYISLLAACRSHKDAPFALRIHDELIESCTPLNDDQRSAITVLTANAHSSTGDHHRSLILRENLYRDKPSKYAGITSTEIDGVLCDFYSHDKRHPRTHEIYQQLELLHDQLKAIGYQPNESIVTKEEDHAEWSLYAHSERLAIALNLISTPNGTTIHLTKNLRMCIDCHEVSKLIARVTQRELIVRDRLRIHHFTKDGRCSCDNHF